MKIYFAGSIRGGRDDKEHYKNLINMLNNYGTVLTEHIGLDTLSDKGQQELSEEQIYQQDTQWIHGSDIVVAEVTQPSLGVGYELAFAEKLGKPVICLFRSDSGKSLSAMIRGNDYFTVIEYSSVDELQPFFNTMLKTARI